MKVIPRLVRALPVWIVSTTIIAAADKPAEKPADKPAGPEVARVAIIRYEDKTGSKNFEYMPGSLREAITKSMHYKFEFTEVDAEKVQPVYDQIKAKNKGKITPKESAEICRKADVDILIYGFFTFNKTDNEIEIHTEISLGSTDKYRTLVPVENRVDATIFQAADKVASDIVAEITKVAIEQQQAKGKAAETEKGKTQLAKTDKFKGWVDQNWMISLGVGPMRPLIFTDTAKVNMDGMAALHIARRFSGPIHLGFLGTFGGMQTRQTSGSVTSHFSSFAGAITAGYFFDLSARWRATTMAGVGYYIGTFDRYLDCTNCSSGSSTGFQSENTRVRNPFALTRFGIHFLIFSFLAIGLEADYRVYFDSPKPVQAAGANLVLSGAF